MTQRIKKKETLSDKIAGILSTAPTTFDPEDDIHDETAARVYENNQNESENEEVALSKFRKQNVDLLEDIDQKYVGKKTSRKSLKSERSGDEWTTEDEGLSTDEGEALDGISGTQDIESDSEDEEEGSEDQTDGEKSGSDDSEYENGEEVQDDSGFKHMSETNVSSHVKKGQCVRNQLNIWESLLEMRIQLQKCLITSNKLPQFDVYQELDQEKDFHSAVSKTKQSVKNALDKFLTLQLLLLKQFPETKTLLGDSKKKKKAEQESDEEIPSDSDAEGPKKEEEEEDDSEEETPKKRQKTSDVENEIRLRHSKYRDYRNSVLQKWNEKTRLTLAKNNANNSSSIVQHINFLLEDKAKLVRRTQLKRSEYTVVGKETPEIKQVEAESEVDHPSKLPDEYDTEIYDDDDFYHQLLRELIEYKSAGITDPVQMSRQWIALQNIRSKMKRKVDTRATKGRKIRYAVHSKLVNFMASIDDSSWTQEAKNELYSSIFGKNKCAQA